MCLVQCMVGAGCDSIEVHRESIHLTLSNMEVDQMVPLKSVHPEWWVPGRGIRIKFMCQILASPCLAASLLMDWAFRLHLKTCVQLKQLHIHLLIFQPPSPFHCLCHLFCVKIYL